MRSAKFSKIVIFSVCVLLVFAVAAALLFSNGASLPASGNVIAASGEGADRNSGEYPAVNYGYQHGTNIDRSTSGASAVSNETALRNALNGSGSYYLTQDITLSANNSFDKTNTFKGTLYGNGHTVTVTGPLTSSSGVVSNIASGTNIGGLVSKLSGKIYDLNVVLKNGTSAAYVSASGKTEMRLGLIAGVIDGGTVENCTVTIPSGSKLAALAATSNGFSNSNGANVGGVAGNCNGSMTIKNVTVTNNGEIVSGLSSSFNNSTSYSMSCGMASMFVGFIWNDQSSYTQIMNNVIAKGNGSLKGYVASNLGMTYTSTLPLTVNNYYNQYSGGYNYGNDGGWPTSVSFVSYTLFKWAKGNDSSKVVNYYHSSGTKENMMSTGCYAVPDNSITVSATDYTVYFDPRQEDLNNSLAVVKTGVTGGQNYTASITTNSGTTYSDRYSFSDDGGTVIFRRLPMAISNWSNNGTFNCTINITQNTIEVTPVAAVNKWESSYCSNKVNTGTAVSDGAGLASAIAANSGDIYLTKDITDFTGFNTSTFSHKIYGNGYTVYIVKGNANTTGTVGGLMGTLSGTVKDLRVVLYSSYNRTISTNKLGTGIVAGNLNGGTVDNVYVYIPSGVTFGTNGSSSYESYLGAVAGYSEGSGYTIKNTTVDIDGEIRLDGSWIYMSAFVGKSQATAASSGFNFTNVTLRGTGSYGSDYSATDEPIFMGASTVLFTSDGVNGKATLNLNGFINDFQGSVAAAKYSMYGILTQNKKTGNLTGWTINTSNIYDYDTPLADVNKTSTNNKYIDLSAKRSTVSTTVDGSSVKVTPYFPAGDTTNLVLVAGNGSANVPDLAYGTYTSTTDGSYKVVTIPKSAITAPTTVTLTEPVTPAEPIADLNKWENGYLAPESATQDGTGVSTSAELSAAIANNTQKIYLKNDILDFVGFGHTGIFSGTLDGNGHTIYIVKASSASGSNAGGLFSTLTGTVKNVRIVVTTGVDLSSTAYVGAVAGALDDNATVSNVNVIINSGVGLVISGSSSNVGGAGGIAGGLINGSGKTVTISNSTVVLNGTLKATAQYTFIAGFVGHLNGVSGQSKGAITFTDLTFKGNGMLDGKANAGEGVHTAGAGVVGGNVGTVNVNGFINEYTGSLSSGRSAYEVVVRNSQSGNTVNISNVYTYGNVTTYTGSMTYGKPVACDKSTIATTVADTQIPVTPYFPASSGGNLVLVAGDGSEACPLVSYDDIVGVQEDNFTIVTIPKTAISANTTVTLVQGKAPVNDPTITTSSEDLVYNGGEIEVQIGQLTSGTTALQSGDYTVTVTAKEGGTGSVSNNKPVNAGDYVITVTLLNDYAFGDDSQTKTVEFSVAKKAVSIEGVTAQERPYDGTTDVTLSGGTLSGVVTADEGKVGFDITGTLDSADAGEGKTVNVTAVLNGEKAGNYELASQPVVTATVTKLSVAVTWSDTSSFEYSGKAQAPTATATGAGQESVNIILKIKNAQGEVQAGGAVNAGTYTAEATTDNANYTLTNATKEFEITRKAISVGVTVAGWTYGEYAQEVNAPVVAGNDGNGDVTYLYEGQTNGGTEYSNPAAPTQAGTYTVKVTVAATQNYEAGEATSAKFTVAKKQLAKPTASDTAYVYTGTAQTYTPDGYDGATMNITGNVQTGADETGYAVTVTLKDKDNYEWTDSTADEAGFTFTIAKATLTDNTQNVVGTYNAAAHSLEIVLNGFVNGEDLESAGGVVKYGTQDGDYTLDSYGVTDAAKAVTVYYQITFANYGTVVGNKTITVNAKQIAVVWDDMSQTYTGSALRPSASVNAGDVEGDDVVDIQVKTTSEGLETQAINVGTYGAAATTTNANYELTNASVDNFEITAADFDAAVQISGWTFGKAASQPTVTNNPGSGNVTYKYTGRGETVYEESETAPTNAGAYTVTATIAASGNYAQKVVSSDFTIEKAVVEVPVVEDKQYTGERITSGLVDNEYYTVQDDGGTEIKVYFATLTLKNGDNYAWASGDDDNDGVIKVQYEIVAQDVHINSWTVNPAVKGWTYGGYTAENAPVYQAAYGNDMVVKKIRLKSGSDTDYVDAGDLSALGAGVYLMKFSVAASIDPDGGESYTGLSAVVEFTVSKAAISVTVSIDGWTYGDVASKPSVSGNTASGEVTYSYVGTGDTAYEASATAPKNAGTYKITATVAETANYSGATAEKEFAIAKKAITATVSANNATYDGAQHVATVAFDGKLADDELTADLLYNGQAAVPVNAGSYTVTVQSYGGAAVGNYDIKTADGEVVLMISPKELTHNDFVFVYENAGSDIVYDGKPHGVDVTVKGGVLVGDDTLNVTVLYDAKEEKPVNAGEYEITITVSGNPNYEMGEDNGEIFEILKATVTVSGANASAVYTGKAFTEEQMISAVFKEADLSLVNVSVSYKDGTEAIEAGDVAILTLTLRDGNNYKFAQGMTQSYTFTVTAGTVSLSGESRTVQYKGTAYTEDEIKNAVFGEGNWTGFNIEISYNNTQALNAGDVATVRVTGYGDPNYSLSPGMTTEYTFTVETLKVEAPRLVENSFEYNGAEQTVSLTDGTYVEISANVKTDKGEYNAVATLKDKANYEWITGGTVDVELPWSITAKEITLKAEISVDKTYDGKAYDFSGYTVTGADGFYSRDNVTVTVSAGTTYTPGTYGIVVEHEANGNYNVTVQATDAKLTVNTAELTITATVARIEYTGSVINFEFGIAGGKVDGDDVSVDTAVYKQNGVPVAPQETGVYDVTFTLKGAQAAYYTALDTQVEITAQTASAPDGMTNDSIVLPTDDDMVYDGEAHAATLNYTATDGNTYGIVYYNGTSYVDEAVNAGRYTVRVYKNTRTNIVENVSRTMTVSPRELTADDVSLPSNPTYTYSGAANTVTATGNGAKGESVTLISVYEGNETAPVNAGTYKVTFRSANGNYTVAQHVSVTMTVYKANVTVPVAETLTYNGTEQTAFADDVSGRYTVGGTFKATDVSEEGYTATFTMINDNYRWEGLADENERSISVTWNVAPASVEITQSDAVMTKEYDGNALTEGELKALFVAPEAKGGGKVAITVTTANGVEVRDTAVYDVTANVADINYTADACVVVYTVTIATPTVNVQVQEKLMQVGDKLSTVGISLAAGSTPGTIAWENPDTVLVEGDNEVTWIFTPADTTNYLGDSGRVTLNVGNEILTKFELVSGPDKTVYNAFDAFDPAGITLTATFEGIEEVQPVTVAECEITFDDGDASVDRLTAKVTEVTLTYGDMQVSFDITVNRLKVEVPALDKTSLEYNSEEQTVSVPEDERYKIVSGNSWKNVGIYNAAVGLNDKVNYEWSDGTTENKALGWEITPVTLSVEITLPENLVYDGTAKVAEVNRTGGTLYGDAQISLTYELVTGNSSTELNGAPVNAGEYEVVAKLPDTVNYRFAEDTDYSVAMTIAKKSVTITTNGDREKYYDGTEVTKAQLADNFSVTDGLSITVSVSGIVLNVGTYTVTAQIDSENTNYTAQPVSYRFTVRKGTREVDARIAVGYKTVEITAEGVSAGEIEYSLDGNVWEPYTGAIQVELQAVYAYYVRYAANSNYNASTQVKVSANVTKDALMQYVKERFTDETVLADAEDIAFLETLAAAADGDNAEFDAALGTLSAERESLVNGASEAVRKALATGGALMGYQAVTTVALALGGVSLAAAAALGIAKRKGGKKDEEK